MHDMVMKGQSCHERMPRDVMIQLIFGDLRRDGKSVACFGMLTLEIVRPDHEVLSMREARSFKALQCVSESEDAHNGSEMSSQRVFA
jgi:hypothetical protein